MEHPKHDVEPMPTSTTSAPTNSRIPSLESPLWSRLAGCERILIAGCGGGYDVFSGLPLFFALHKMVSNHGIE
jgi:hypothetical protein